MNENQFERLLSQRKKQELPELVEPIISKRPEQDPLKVNKLAEGIHVVQAFGEEKGQLCLDFLEYMRKRRFASPNHLKVQHKKESLGIFERIMGASIVEDIFIVKGYPIGDTRRGRIEIQRETATSVAMPKRNLFLCEDGYVRETSEKDGLSTITDPTVIPLETSIGSLVRKTDFKRQEWTVTHDRYAEVKYVDKYDVYFVLEPQPIEEVLIANAKHLGT
jgi:hypothetical protein